MTLLLHVCAALSSEWVVGAEGSLADAQCPLQQRQRLGGPAQGGQCQADVVEGGGHGGVVGAVRSLADAQRPLVQRQRLGGTAQVRQCQADVVEGGGHVGVVGA